MVAAGSAGQRHRPGVFRTDLNANLLDSTERGREFKLRTPIGRFGKTEELVGAAVYLASDAASYVSGENTRGRRRLSGKRSQPITMEYRKLGQTDLNLSIVGFGGATLGAYSATSNPPTRSGLFTWLWTAASICSTHLPTTG